MSLNTEDKAKIIKEMKLKKAELEANILKIEKFIYDQETRYLESTVSSGNILKGWEHFFTSKTKIPNAAIATGKKPRISNNERVFSQTSYNNHMLKDENVSNIQVSNKNININNNSQSTRISVGPSHKHKKKIEKSLGNKKKRTQRDESDLDPDYGV
jgi:hypothetical protein